MPMHCHQFKHVYLLCSSYGSTFFAKATMLEPIIADDSVDTTSGPIDPWP